MLKDIIEDKIGSMIYTTGVLVRSLSSQTYSDKKFIITPEQYLILVLINENEGMHQRQISEITLKDRGNVARIVDILFEKELIYKASDSNGRRIYKIFVTQKGKDLINEIKPTDLELRKIIQNNVTPEELEITKRTLEKIKLNVRDKVRLQI